MGIISPPSFPFSFLPLPFPFLASCESQFPRIRSRYTEIQKNRGINMHVVGCVCGEDVWNQWQWNSSLSSTQGGVRTIRTLLQSGLFTFRERFGFFFLSLLWLRLEYLYLPLVITKMRGLKWSMCVTPLLGSRFLGQPPSVKLCLILDLSLLG